MVKGHWASPKTDDLRWVLEGLLSSLVYHSFLAEI